MSEPNLRAKDQSSAQTEFELHVAVVLSRQHSYRIGTLNIYKLLVK